MDKSKMRDYHRQEQRKRHYPLDGQSSLIPKFLRGQSTIPNMDDYTRPRLRTQHYPLEGLAHSHLAFSRGVREWNKLPPREDYIGSDGHGYPPNLNPCQGYHRAPSLHLWSNDHVYPFVHSPHGLYDSSYPQAFPCRTGHHPLPCPPHGWDPWDCNHDGQRSLEEWHPEQHQIRFDRRTLIVASEVSARHGYWQSLRGRCGREQRGRWQAGVSGHHRALHSGREIEHQKVSTYIGKEFVRAPFQPVNKWNAVGKKQNSDSLNPVDVIDIAKTLHSFIEKLKVYPAKKNSILTIESCVTASHLPIKTSFVIDETVLPTDNSPDCSGALYINNVFIAHSTCGEKKMLKLKVYDEALHFLKTKSIEDLMARGDLGQSHEQMPPKNALNENEVGSKMDDLRVKLLRLQEYIKKSRYPQNLPVMIFYKALLESQCHLNHRYDVQPIRNERGIHMYTKTKVFIEGKTVAQSVAFSKKDSKTRAYQQTVRLFTSLDIDTLLKETFESGLEDDDKMSQEIQELMRKYRGKQNVPKPLSAVAKHEQVECLERLIQDLRRPSKEGVSTVMTIDKNCVLMKMKLLAVYKIVRSPGQQTIITCDLYILDRLVAQGRGTTRKLAQTDAYSKGGDILKKSRGADLIALPKFNEAELSKPDVMDIVCKGYTKVHDSNRCRLNRLKQLPAQKRQISDLVIIEHEDWAEDRKKHSLCILNQSATQCGCLLEWTTEPEDGCVRCTMKLQGEEISSVLATQRKAAVALASSVALFILYETQPVIQGFRLDYPKVWVSRDKLLKHLESCPEEYQNTPDVQANGFQEVDKEISRSMQYMLGQFFSHPTLKDFVGAPDWKPEEKKHLRILAVAQGLRAITDVYCEELLPIISQKHDLSEMVNILETQANKTEGRYRLLPQEEKPSYNDIAGDVAANESFVKQCQVLTGVNDQYKLLLQTNDVDDDVDIDNYVANDDLSLTSDNSAAFITAHSTFDMTAANGKREAGDTAPVHMISKMALPRTSTPVKVTSDITSHDVDGSQLLKLAMPSLDDSGRRKHCISTSPTAAVYFDTNCSQIKSASILASTSALAQSSVFETLQRRSSLDQSPARFSALLHPEFNGGNSSTVDIHQQVKQTRLSQLHSKSSLNKLLTCSIDIETGMNGTDQMKQEYQHWVDKELVEQQGMGNQQCIGQQQPQQWVEQEHYQDYHAGQ